MIFLKSYSMLTFILIANVHSISAFSFPTERSTVISTTTESSTQFITTVSSSSETTTNINNLQDYQTERNNQTQNNNQTQSNNITEINNQTEVNIESFCGGQPGGEYNCVDPPGYPEEIILKAVASQQEILRSFFDEESSDPSIISTSTPPSRLKSRIESSNENDTKVEFISPFRPPKIINGDNTTQDQLYDDSQDYGFEEEFKNICSTRSDHIMPRAARNTRGEFQFIVNHTKGNNSFIQKVEVGECVNANKECGDGEVFDARTECHQEFLEHKLVAVSNDGGQVVVDTFTFPSCCTCRIISYRF